MIRIDTLGGSGHGQEVFMDDPSPEERKKIAEKVGKKMREGYTCFLEDGQGGHHQITGYDSLTNSWMTKISGEIVPAAQSVVTASRAIQGG